MHDIFPAGLWGCLMMCVCVAVLMGLYVWAWSGRDVWNHFSYLNFACVAVCVCVLALRVPPAETRLTVYRRLLHNTGASVIGIQLAQRLSMVVGVVWYIFDCFSWLFSECVTFKGDFNCQTLHIQNIRHNHAWNFWFYLTWSQRCRDHFLVFWNQYSMLWNVVR